MIRDNQESYFSPVNTAIEVCISKVLYKIKILQKDFIFFKNKKNSEGGHFLKFWIFLYLSSM